MALLPQVTRFRWAPTFAEPPAASAAFHDECGFYTHAVGRSVDQLLALPGNGFGRVLDDLERWVGALRLPANYVAEAWFDLFGTDENGAEQMWRVCGYTGLTGANMRERVAAAIAAALQDPSNKVAFVDRIQMFVRVRAGQAGESSRSN